MLVLGVTAAILLVLAGLGIALPLFAVRRGTRPPVSELTLFAAIGLGFLVFEVVLIQRFVLFLGFPTYALSIVLFALLAFTGIGARLTERVADGRAGLSRALAIACGLVALTAFGLDPLLRALIDAPFAARVALTVVLLAPAGLTLGAAMPLGLRRLGALHAEGVPWAWGVEHDLLRGRLGDRDLRGTAGRVHGRHALRARLLPRRPRVGSARGLAEGQLRPPAQARA